MEGDLAYTLQFSEVINLSVVVLDLVSHMLDKRSPALRSHHFKTLMHKTFNLSEVKFTSDLLYVTLDLHPCHFNGVKSAVGHRQANNLVTCISSYFINYILGSEM